MRTFIDTSEAYREVLRDVYYNYDYRAAPRGLAIREKVDYTFRVERPSSSPIQTADEDRNSRIAAYTAKEVELYNSGTNRLEDFAKASKFWQKIANPDGTINSAYGHLIWHKHSLGNPLFASESLTPWEWARTSLMRDKDTRQSVLRFSLPEHQWLANRDQVCTMHGNFLIREDKLHFTVTMRSNDVVLGLVYDLPWFCSLMDKMVDELKPTYPNLSKGYYTHFAHSLHAYERDAETIQKMLGDQFTLQAP